MKKSEIELEIPRVGLAIILLKNDEVLLGKRKGSYGNDELHFPGGHLEFFEHFKPCAYRELEEETDLKKGNIKLIDDYPSAITNDFFINENKHYVTLYMRARYISGTPKSNGTR